MIYACGKLCGGNARKARPMERDLPDNQHFVEATIPKGASYEVATPDIVSGWDRPDRRAPRRFAAAWYAEKRSLVLNVRRSWRVWSAMSSSTAFTRNPGYTGNAGNARMVGPAAVRVATGLAVTPGAACARPAFADRRDALPLFLRVAISPLIGDCSCRAVKWGEGVYGMHSAPHPPSTFQHMTDGYQGFLLCRQAQAYCCKELHPRFLALLWL